MRGMHNPYARMLRAAPVARIALLAALAAPFAASAADQTVPTAAVGGTSAHAGFELDGSVQARQQTTVAAQLAGNVLALAVKSGDRVKAGQLLVRVDDRDAQAGLLGADAGVSQADAQWRQARTHAERTRNLRQTGFVSQAALDDAETQLKAAQAGLTQAQAGRSQAALARSFASVTAPFDGIVLATHVEAGDLASPGRPLVTLYAPGALRAVVQVPSSRANLARGATSTQVQLPDGRWVAPVTRTELPTADPVSQTVEWRLDLAPGTPLAPGQALRVRFGGAPSAADGIGRPILPASAVLRRGELTAVYAVQGERFVLKAVRLGARLGDGGYELLAGLQRGERVALDPVRAGLAGARPAAQ